MTSPARSSVTLKTAKCEVFLNEKDKISEDYARKWVRSYMPLDIMHDFLMILLQGVF